MKILTLSLSMALFVTGISTESYAFGENRLEQVNELYQPAFAIDETEFSMFPQEKEFSGFPNGGVEAESDPQTLGDYYQTVAQAYRNWGDRQKSIVQVSQNNILTRVMFKRRVKKFKVLKTLEYHFGY
ncbi:MAG: hypothetical protein ACRYGR_08885 [Janthinobacterium lividum]